MENYPLSSFESGKSPEETGEDKDTRKRKKSKRTRVQKVQKKLKGTGILPVTQETTEKKAEEDDQPQSLTDILGKKETPKDKKTEIEEEQAEETELVLPTPEEGVIKEEIEEVPAIEETANGESEIAASEQDTIEGEFAEASPLTIKLHETIESNEEQTETVPEVEPPFFATVISETLPENPREVPPVSEILPPPPETPVIPTLAGEPAPPREYYETIPSEPAGDERHMALTESTAKEKVTSTSATGGPEKITRAELNEATRRAEKRGLSRGVVSGGLAGWWFGRRGRDEALARAKVAEREAEHQKEIAEAHNRYNSVKRENEVLQHTYVETRKEASPFEHTTTPAAKAEQTPFQNANTLPRPQTEQNLEEQPITERTYEVSPGRRVETSAWHRVEVDEKTGQAVENPSLKYGEEFYKEQRQEKLHRDAAQPQVAAQVGATLLNSASVTNDNVTPQSTSQSQSATKPSSKSMLKIWSEDKEYIKKQFIRRTSDPVTWILALGLVVLLVLVGIL